MSAFLLSDDFSSPDSFSKITSCFSLLFRAFLLCLLGIIFLSSAYAQNENRAFDFLMDSIKSSSRVNYGGVMVFGNAGSSQTINVKHFYKDGMQIIELSSMSGNRVEHQYISLQRTRGNSAEISSIDGRKIPVRIFSFFDETQKELIREHYTFMFGESVRVAGRSALVVEILPRDKFRFAHRMAIDKQSKVLLRAQMLNHDFRILEELFYATFTVLPKDIGEKKKIDSSVIPRDDMNQGGYKNCLPDNMPVRDFWWKVDWLPKGFSSSSKKHFRCLMSQDGTSDSLRITEHQMFSDGLASISVFITNADKNTLGNIVKLEQNQWGMGLYTYMYSDDSQIITVGEVPLDTLKRVARSVQRVKK